MNYTHTFNSSKLNEFRGGVMRLVGLPDTPDHLEIPGITITGTTGFGQAGYPNGWWQTNWHFKDIFTWVASNHMFKMGGELRQMYGSATTTNYIPAYSFTSLLNFTDDEAIQMTRYVDPRTGEPVTAYSELTQTEWALFINDDWKIRPNFTLNVGLRYENYGTFKDSDDGLRNIIYGPGANDLERLAGRNSTGMARTLLGGWQLAGSALLQSGSPINVVTGNTFPRGDLNADNNGGDRPNAPAAGIKTSGWSQDEYLNGIFKVSDFPLPAAGENGNLPRNAYRGPGYVDVSLSVTKKFRVQRWSGEFRLDAFNAFNRVNLADPTMDMSSTNFGRVTSQLAPRAFQLGARLRF